MIGFDKTDELLNIKISSAEECVKFVNTIASIIQRFELPSIFGLHADDAEANVSYIKAQLDAKKIWTIILETAPPSGDSEPDIADSDMIEYLAKAVELINTSLLGFIANIQQKLRSSSPPNTTWLIEGRVATVVDHCEVFISTLAAILAMQQVIITFALNAEEKERQANNIIQAYEANPKSFMSALSPVLSNQNKDGPVEHSQGIAAQITWGFTNTVSTDDVDKKLTGDVTENEVTLSSNAAL